MALYVKDAGGSWKDLKSLHIKHNDEWKRVKKAFIKNNGEWKRVIPPTGSKTFLNPGYWQTFEVPQMIDVIYITAIGGGGGAGNVVDGGRNDDYGAGGCGASGQWIKKYPIRVTPHEIISVYIGYGGGNASGHRDQHNTGGSGTATYISCSSGTYILYGGAGGRGGVGDAGNQYYGGVANPTTWTDYKGTVHTVGSDGQDSAWVVYYSYGPESGAVYSSTASGAQTAYNNLASSKQVSYWVDGYWTDDGYVDGYTATGTYSKSQTGGPSLIPTGSPRRRGGRGFLTTDGVLGAGQQQSSYGRSGGPYYGDMDATEFGGGGAGIMYSYIREDNGNSPGWGGKGRSGMVTIDW